MKTLVICDIQQMYQSDFSFKMGRFVSWINRTRFDKYIFLYNGYETCGNVDQNGMFDYYINYGVKENLLENAIFYDKGCSEYFELMDEFSVEEEEIVTIGKWCYQRNYYSLDINNNSIPDEIVKIFQNRGFNYFSMNASYVPIKPFVRSNISLIGGFTGQCLKEVRLNLQILDAKFKMIDEFVY